MNALTRSLREEHTLIRRGLACLDQLVDYATAMDDMCVASAAELLEFFEEFADRVHQEKEERHLFPALLASGVAEKRVRALLDEHKGERATLAEMRCNLEGTAYGDPLSRDHFVWHTKQYVMLQREHAADEERYLLPLAEEILSDEAGRRALAGCRETEAELLPRPAAHYVAIVERIEVRLGLAAPARADPAVRKSQGSA